MPDTIGQAYIQILPTTEGITGQMNQLLGAPAEEAGGKAGGGWTAGFSKALKIGGATVAAASGVIADVSRRAIDSYADYEQYVGGIETLFGESAETVIRQASEAYKTAGMDANAYMETAIQSAAAMVNSLSGDQSKAAELMGMSITDMSDNVNKMGTSMEAVQNAYRGFSRGNFTMLDNLALGFAGTREGMQQLLDKAQELSGVEYDIESYSDIVQAIHVVQTEMGITGTTAREASETISGSVASTKAAWKNLITGLADENANIGELVDYFVDSAMQAGENILPRIGVVLNGISTLIGEGASKLIPIAIEALISNLPQLVESGAELIGALVAGLIRAIPELVKATPQIVMAIVKGLISAWPEIRDAGRDLIDELWTNGIRPALGDMWNAGAEAVRSFWDGVKSLASEAWQWGADLIQNFIDGITARFSRLRETVSNAAQTVRNFLHFSEPEEGPLSDFSTYAPDMMELFTQGIREGEPELRRQISQTFDFSADILPAAPVQQNGQGAAKMQQGAGPRYVVIPLMLKETELGRVIVDLYDTRRAQLGIKLTGGATA